MKNAKATHKAYKLSDRYVREPRISLKEFMYISQSVIANYLDQTHDAIDTSNIDLYSEALGNFKYRMRTQYRTDFDDNIYSEKINRETKRKLSALCEYLGRVDEHDLTVDEIRNIDEMFRNVYIDGDKHKDVEPVQDLVPAMANMKLEDIPISNCESDIENITRKMKVIRVRKTAKK
jgi:hypothetical protein